jgi:hypothetical protein
VVFLEQDVDETVGARLNRRWTGYSGPGDVDLPLVMVDSGHRLSSGWQPDFKAAYRKLVDAELARAPHLEIEAYVRRVGSRARVCARLHNTSGVALSVTNRATVHALVWENAHVGVTSRIMRAAPLAAISPPLAPGGELGATLETPDLSGVNWDVLHTVVVADYVPGPSRAFDMLQGAVAEPAGLFANPESVTFRVDAGSPADRSAPLQLRGPYVLNWTAVSDRPWITVAPDAGAVGTQPVLTAAADGLSPGWQEGAATFTASSPDGMSFAATITVRAYLGARALRIASVEGPPGAAVALPVELDALGDENSVDFRVVFDPAVFVAFSVAAGADAASATFGVEDSEAGGGRLGVTVTLPPGQTFQQGGVQLAVLTLTVAPAVPAQTAAVALTDQPVARQVADPTGALLSATFLDGAVAVRGRSSVRTPRRHLAPERP